MNDEVRTINIEGIEVQTSLTPVELADLPQKYAELQSNWNSLKQMLKEENYFEIVDKMSELEGVDNE